MTAGWAARRAQSTQFCTPSQLVVAARADAIPAVPRAAVTGESITLRVRRRCLLAPASAVDACSASPGGALLTEAAGRRVHAGLRHQVLDPVELFV